MFCSNCGNKLNENDKFCSNCGFSNNFANSTSVVEKENTNEINLDMSQFGNDKISACKYIAKTYHLNLTEAKKIVDKKYDEEKRNLKELSKKFTCTKRIGPLEVDATNRLFKVIGAKKEAFVQKKSHGLVSNTLAIYTLGFSRLFENAKQTIQTTNPTTIYNFNDINSFELLEDNTIITSGGLGSAALATFVTGSYVAGNIGAIVGDKKQKNEVNMMSIKLNMNNLNNSCVFIPLITKTIKKDSKEYKNAYNLAQQILSVLSAIQNN